MKTTQMLCIATCLGLLVPAFSETKGTSTRARGHASDTVTTKGGTSSDGARPKSTTATTFSVIPQTTDSRVRISYQFGQAQGWYTFKGDTLSWREPVVQDTNHVSVKVEDTRDGRFLPDCKVAVLGSDSTTSAGVFSATACGLTWYPDYYAYSCNVTIPESTKDFALAIKVDPPNFNRADKDNGDFFTQTLIVETTVTVTDRTTSVTREKLRSPDRALFPKGRHPAITPTPYPGSE